VHNPHVDVHQLVYAGMNVTHTPQSCT